MSGGGLEFEHVASFACAGSLLLCDVDYLPPRFAGMQAGRLTLALELEVESGAWQLFLVRGPSEGGGPGAIQFVLLAHERELDLSEPLESAETLAILRVDSGRIAALDADLRGDLSLQKAAREAPREQLPCALRPLESAPDSVPRGALLDLDLAGVFELLAAPQRRRRAIFFAASEG